MPLWEATYRPVRCARPSSCARMHDGDGRQYARWCFDPHPPSPGSAHGRGVALRGERVGG
eukprot:6207838-Pleurochrysis_carterae.AAC.1